MSLKKQLFDQKLSFCGKIAMTPESRGEQGTAVILTALSVEFESVLVHIGQCREQECKGTLYEQGIFSTKAWTWQVAIAQIGAGNVGAAVEVERAITCFQPSVVFFISVAGGVKDVEIGDVVSCHQSVWP